MRKVSKAKLLDKVSAKLVKPEWAERVVSPAYDMLRATEREKLMDEDPYVFLHVTSAKSSLPVEAEQPLIMKPSKDYLMLEHILRHLIQHFTFIN